MAFLRFDTESAGGVRRLSGIALRWIVVPGAATAFAVWSLSTLSGAYSATAPLSSSASFMPRLPSAAASAGAGRQAVAFSGTAPQGKTGRIAVVSASLSAPAIDLPGLNVSVFPRRTLDERFEKVAASAALSPKKLADVLARAGLARAKVSHAAPARERFQAVASAGRATPEANRFGPGPGETERASRLALALSGSSAGVQLAYADPSPLPAASAFDTLLATPPDAALDSAIEPDRPLFSELPDNIPLPLQRPRLAARPAEPAQDKPAQRAIAARPAVEEAPARPARRQQSGQMLAFARPNDPSESGGLAGAFKNLFSPKPKRPRDGVAIYDISAAKVYMPDGSVLEAHSGIGPMADNPRYVNQKMRGPTPPDTYNLSMRESLFHGVEALRMTPVSGRVGYNRSGILAHSYLLRGGRAESHGCVAFREYPKFLKAFKQGKIRQLVVVPGARGKAPSTAVAQNGRGA